MKRLFFGLFLSGLMACTQEPPPPPVCEGDPIDPPSLDCVWLEYPDCQWDCSDLEPPDCDFAYLRENCEYGVNRLKCECAPPPDSVPKADPTDYLRLTRIDSNGGPEEPNDILFWRSHKWVGLLNGYDQQLFHQGEQDIYKVLRNCPWAFPNVFGMSKQEAIEFAEVSHLLGNENNAFIRKMWKRDEPDNPRNLDGTPKPNRRCDPDNKNYDPNFLDGNGNCKVSNVRKDVFSEYKGRLLPQIEASSVLRRIAGKCRTDDMEAFDSIAGWCRAINLVERTSCP